MAFDYGTLQAMEASEPANATSYCPECGRPWADPPPGSPRPAARFPWRAVLLVVVGLALAIIFGLRAVTDYPRALRDHAILQAVAACLAQIGGRADCAPSNVAPNGSIDVSALVDQAAAMRRKLGGDLLAAIGGAVTVLLGLWAAMSRRLRARGREAARPVTMAIAGVGEGLAAISCPLVLALAVGLLGGASGQRLPLAGDVLDRAVGVIDALISFIAGGGG
jgi:hypothetical protein